MKGRDQWRDPRIEEKRIVVEASALLRDQPWSQELLPEEERADAAHVRAATGREINARREFRVFAPATAGIPSKAAASRRVPTWEMVDGRRGVAARPVAEIYRGPDCEEGPLETSGRVSLRPSHPQVLSMCALRILKMWSLATRKASTQPGELNREVHLRAPQGRNPQGVQRDWRPRAPAYGLGVAPVAFFGTLNGYLWRDKESLAIVGIRFQASKFDQRLYFVSGARWGAGGIMKTHIDDIPGCGERDAPGMVRRY